MITIYGTKIFPVEGRENLVKISFIEGDVDLSNISNMLRFGQIGYNNFNFVTLLCSFNSLLDLQEEGIQNASDNVKLEYLEKKLKKKIPNGYWFTFPTWVIVDGADSFESYYFPDYNCMNEIPSIGFGATKEEAYLDALNRIKRKILRYQSTGLLQILGNVDRATIPHYSNFECIRGKDLRKYLLVSENNDSEENKNNCQPADFPPENAITIKVDPELAILRKENSELKNRITELESKLQNLKSSIQRVLQDY